MQVEVTFLTGRYVATSEDSRDEPEWPPHPARLFSALVAVWAEDGADEDERRVLEWLERLPAPEIAASRACSRSHVVHYVPVNDASVVGLSETQRRGQKLDALFTELAEFATDASQQGIKKAARLEAQIKSERDVTAKVTHVGNTNVASALELLPGGRNRQARSWPSVRPHQPVVRYRWPDVVPSERALHVADGLASRLSRLGHSSSLVSVRVTPGAEASPDSTWIPDPAGSRTLRWVQPGQLRTLERLYADHRASRPRTLPKIGVRYLDPFGALAPVVPSPARGNLSGDWLVFEIEARARRLPTREAARLGSRLHKALIAHAREPTHWAISGHADDGSPLREPHAAFVSVPHVGSAHATGSILGLAVLLPTDIDTETRQAVVYALARWQAESDGGGGKGVLTLGGLGRVRLERPVGRQDLLTLQRSTWSGPARRWVSATPIALPRHPGELRSRSAAQRETAWRRAEEHVAEACTHLGLPRPLGVELSRSPLLLGAEHAARFPPFVQSGTTRVLLHAMLTFGESVEGPLVIGSGRFVGLGLMRPVSDEDGVRGG